MGKRLQKTALLVGFLFFAISSTWGQWACGPTEIGQDGTTKDGGNGDGGQKDTVGQDNGTPENPPPKDDTTKDGGPQDNGTTDGGEPPQDGGPPETTGDEITRPAFLQPQGFVPLNLPTKEWPLPAALAKSPIVALEIEPSGNVLFGNELGLFEITGTKVRNVDSKVKIVGIAPWKDGKMLVAEAQKIHLWDGTALKETKLFKHLDGSDITAIETRGPSTAWIGTTKSLWLLTNDVVREFNQIKGVRSVEHVAGFKLVLLVDQQGRHISLQEGGDGRWLMRDFSTEGVTLEQMAAHVEEPIEFWGFSQSAGLYLRKAEQGLAAWWPFRLKPDSDDNDTVQVSALVFHPKPDTAWAIGTSTLYRLTEKTAGEQSLPGTLGPITFKGGTSDGGLWLSDGKKLYRIGATGPAASYAADVEPIMKADCIQCHAKGKKAAFAPFETLAQVKNRAAVIIKRLKEGTMPPAGKLSQAKIDTIQSWINGGYQP